MDKVIMSHPAGMRNQVAAGDTTVDADGEVASLAVKPFSASRARPNFRRKQAQRTRVPMNKRSTPTSPLASLLGQGREAPLGAAQGDTRTGTGRGVTEAGVDGFSVSPVDAGAAHEILCRFCIELVGYPSRSLSM